MLKLLLYIIAAFAVTVSCYTWLNWLAGQAVRAWLLKFPSERFSFREAASIWILPFWTGGIILLYLGCTVFTGGGLGHLFTNSFRLGMLIEGVFLGIGEGAVALILASLLLRLAAPLRSKKVGNQVSLEFRLLGQTGWMRTFYNVFNIIPQPWSYFLIVLPLFGEELIFRGLLIPAFLPYSRGFAIAFTTLVFITVQFINMPSWYQGLAPGLGALIMGLSNAYLFCLQQNLTAVTIAHLSFFVFMVGPSSASRVPGQRQSIYT